MKGVIVPEDGTILVDGKHWHHHDMSSLKIRDKTAKLRPSICVKAAHFDDATGMYLIEWTPPQHTFLTKEKFVALFGDVIEEHTAAMAKFAADQLAAAQADEDQTRRVAEHDNNLFDQRTEVISE